MKSVLFVALFMGLNTNAIAGGEGRNGPDLQGISIPVSMDRLISIKKIGEAESKCLSQHVVGPAVFQVSGAKPNVLVHSTVYRQQRYFSVSGASAYCSDGIMNGQSCKPITLSGIYLESYSFFFGGDHRGYSLQIRGTGPSYELSLNLPVFDYISVEDVDLFDDLGGKVGTALRISEIRARGEISQELPFINKSTGQPTAVKVNSEAYVDCVAAEIAN